jgi:hypothetical protein
MKPSVLLGLLLFCLTVPQKMQAQPNENKTGAWYMYFFDVAPQKNQWGVQGDLQIRNWNMAGDLEQLLLRGGLTYRPKKAKVKLTLGYGNIRTGEYGSSKTTTLENRIYQEAFFPVKFGDFLYTNHRFRFEQRFVENQDLRTRYRYNLMLNIPLFKTQIDQNTWYVSFYNELFINGERKIGDEKPVAIFDRNRSYAAVGYALKKNLKIQLGLMNQNTNEWRKSQLQLSLHQNL